ncbi:hypothetical protein Agub_g10620, partial [Astrephomene gubernaculifera]
MNAPDRLADNKALVAEALSSCLRTALKIPELVVKDQGTQLTELSSELVSKAPIITATCALAKRQAAKALAAATTTTPTTATPASTAPPHLRHHHHQQPYPEAFPSPNTPATARPVGQGPQLLAAASARLEA